MRIISCASYYGSGSSAITDLISEYEDVFSLTNEEFRFVQDPNGISDLEYNLVENFNRHNSGWALKQYKKKVDFYSGNFLTHRYEKYFKGNWKKISYNYINELTDFSYKGSWVYDILAKGTIYFYFTLILNKLLKETIWRKQPERSLNLLKNEITYCSHPSEEKFLKLTRNYIFELFNSISGNSSNIMVDQIVPSTNLKRYIRYFDDIKVIIVDRDPRDIYCLEKNIWKDGLVPNSPKIFCKWYKYTRYGRNKELRENKTNVKFIQFEDLIYNYDATVKEIENWLGLKHHIYPKKFLNPNKSIKNTRTWGKYPYLKKDIKFIEEKLSDYLYEYDK